MQIRGINRVSAEFGDARLLGEIYAPIFIYWGYEYSLSKYDRYVGINSMIVYESFARHDHIFCLVLFFMF